MGQVRADVNRVQWGQSLGPDRLWRVGANQVYETCYGLVVPERRIQEPARLRHAHPDHQRYLKRDAAWAQFKVKSKSKHNTERIRRPIRLKALLVTSFFSYDQVWPRNEKLNGCYTSQSSGWFVLPPATFAKNYRNAENQSLLQVCRPFISLPIGRSLRYSLTRGVSRGLHALFDLCSGDLEVFGPVVVDI